MSIIYRMSRYDTPATAPQLAFSKRRQRCRGGDVSTFARHLLPSLKNSVYNMAHLYNMLYTIIKYIYIYESSKSFGYVYISLWYIIWYIIWWELLLDIDIPTLVQHL